MRGPAAIDVLARAILQEFPGLDATRLRAAIERAHARMVSDALDTEGSRLVSQQLARVEAAEESAERAAILRTLATELAGRGDAGRAFVLRLSAFAEQPAVDDLDALLQLAAVTERHAELPLDAMTVLIDGTDAATPARLRGIALAWRERGDAYRAADAFERVLLADPADDVAHDALETFYRATAEWPVLVDLLRRRLEHVRAPAARAELYREVAQTLERELGDDAGARDAYRDADRLAPDHPDVLDALARLAVKLGGLEDEAVGALERQSSVARDPAARARVLLRAAEIARLTDWDRAQQLFERALADDPDLAEAIDGLVYLLRDRGELARAIDVLAAAAGRASTPAALRSRWLAEAADFSVAQLDTERAKQLYRDARVADPTNHHAGLALVELCWDTGAIVELAPILAELCATTTEPARLRGYLLQLARVARELDDRPGLVAALARANAIDPSDPVVARELADLRFDAAAWPDARALYLALLDEHEAALADDDKVRLHERVARAAHASGDAEAAARHVDIALALAPTHASALHLRSELANADPFARAADQLALANLSPASERAQRFAAVGDRYFELGDVATARELYREALLYAPTDRMLLTKSLGLVADDGDWSYSLDLVQRLAESETEPGVRARYRHLAAMIARDNLDDPERAAPLFERALDDDPELYVAADELEAMLGAGGAAARPQLAAFYTRRLGHVRDREGRPGERVRLWDRLADACLELDRVDDAVVAREVALSLVAPAPDADPADVRARREALAALYARAGAHHDEHAIAQHHALLAEDRARVASYGALAAAYRRRGLLEHARACEDARAAIAGGPPRATTSAIAELFDVSGLEPAAPAPPPIDDGERVRRPLKDEDWAAIAAQCGVDPHVTALVALLAPPFAAERARVRPPRGLPGKDVRDRDLPSAIARVLAQVLSAFALSRPPVYVDREQPIAAALGLRARDGVLAPVLVLGRRALDAQLTDRELAFALARQLADLRAERIARVLCPRANELAQLIELALAPGEAQRWVDEVVHAALRDRVRGIAARLREAGVEPMRAARAWRAATDRAADRVGLIVCGDLGAALRVLEGDGAGSALVDPARAHDLAWASASEPVLAARARVEGWRR